MSLTEKAKIELSKRRREVFVILSLIAAFLGLTWIEFRLLNISQQLPFQHSVFFFGLVNFNIIILLLLFFMIFRNVVKIFVERQGKVIGSSLKAKLVAAFVAFASVPTALMFLISVIYINSSFDKWFSVRMGSVLKSAVEVNQEYIFSAKKKNYHFASEINKEVRQLSLGNRALLSSRLEALRSKYSLDAVEYYPDLFAQRIVVRAKGEAFSSLPASSLELLRKAVVQRENASTIHHFGEGNLIRVVVPSKIGASNGALVISSFIPFSFISRMDDISSAHEDFRNVNPLQYPLKSIYLVILILMTLVILLCATWFGFYLARELSIPLESLGSATLRVSKGDYRPVELVSGSMEINRLIDNFNQMTSNLDRSKREVLEANANLTQTLERLDEHSRYIQVVLSNITTGVISVDQRDRVTTINRHAQQLLGIEEKRYVGYKVKDVLDPKYQQVLSEMLSAMREQKLTNLQREITIDLRGRIVPLMTSITLLHDERGNEMGMVLVFDDLTMLVSAQRAAAWTEVARRIAHEIKNPLTPIKLSAQRLEKRFGDQISDPAFKSCTSMIIRQTDDLKRLVNEFSNFARLPQAVPVIADLKQVAQQAIELFQNAHREVQFNFEAEAALPRFRFDPDQINRILINLLDNAVAAVAQSVSPRISVRLQYDTELKIARIMVVDNGPGISEALRERIFEPYFSTKEAGSGLGLAIVKRIVEDHNGFVRAMANEPQGTRMIIELPALQATDTLLGTPPP